MVLHFNDKEQLMEYAKSLKDGSFKDILGLISLAYEQGKSEGWNKGWDDGVKSAEHSINNAMSNLIIWRE